MGQQGPLRAGYGAQKAMFSTSLSLTVLSRVAHHYQLTQGGPFAEELEKGTLSNPAIVSVWAKVCRPLDRDLYP